MACFSVESIITLLIWLVVICAVIAILRLLIGWIVPKLGIVGEAVGIIMQVLWIILWAVVIIAVLLIVGDLLSCLIGMAPRIGMHPGR